MDHPRMSHFLFPDQFQCWLAPRPDRPATNEPGSLRQQIEALRFYWSTPWRRHDPEGSWQVARGLTLGRAVT